MGCCGSHSFALLRQGRRVGKIPSCSRTAPQHPISHIRRREEARRSRPLKAAGLASPEPPVATVLQVPTPAPGAAWKLGARERGASRSPALCVPNPGTPRCRLGRALRSPPGGRHVAEPGARPPRPSGTHSGAAAGPASWGLSGLPAPRPGRSPRLCRASVRPAGSQPSRAGERTTRAGESRAPAAAPGCLAADCPALGKGRAGTAGAGLPGPPPHWASSGGGGAKPSRTVPGSPRAPTRARRETRLDQRQRWGDPPGRARWGRSWRTRGATSEAQPLSPGLPIKTGVPTADASAETPKGV